MCPIRSTWKLDVRILFLSCEFQFDAGVLSRRFSDLNHIRGAYLARGSSYQDLGELSITSYRRQQEVRAEFSDRPELGIPFIYLPYMSEGGGYIEFELSDSKPNTNGIHPV